MRLIAFSIVSYIKNYMSSKNIKLSNLDFHMQRIKKSYLYQFKDESHVFEIRKREIRENCWRFIHGIL